MSKQGFVVQKQYLLSTAWIATFRHGDEEGGRVVGVNSEVGRDRVVLNLYRDVYSSVIIDGCITWYRPRLWTQSHRNRRCCCRLCYQGGPREGKY